MRRRSTVVISLAVVAVLTSVSSWSIGGVLNGFYEPNRSNNHVVQQTSLPPPKTSRASNTANISSTSAQAAPFTSRKTNDTIPTETINLTNGTLQYSNVFPWPPIESILTGEWNITGDPQFLLDFAIIGNAKCGTSTMMEWLNNHEELYLPQGEVYDLMQGRPARLVQRIYDYPKSARNQKRGYKSPSDVREGHVFQYFHDYWPQTKLIVGIRHPVRWFESLYNFRVQNYQKMPHANKLIGKCQGFTKGTCTHMGEFHVHLARMLKTLTNVTDTSRRRELLMKQGGIHRHRYAFRLRKNLPMDAPPNPVFLYETSQLADSNQSRASQFRSDLARYLGVQTPFPPPVHVKPGKRHFQAEEQAEKERRKIDICNETYVPLRKELMIISRDASLWFRRFFLKSPDVVVSSPSFMEEILESWNVDPCDPN